MTQANDIALKILVVEDETAATVNLLSIISEVCPNAEVLATTESVTETVEWLENNASPDIIFMDIHLADGDAFRIFEKTEITAPVVFTTAYDQYALEAFSVNSIDYLLKPINASDLKRAVDKLSRLTGSAALAYSERQKELATVKNNRGNFLIHVRDKIIPVKKEEIAFFYTSDERVTICTHDGRTFPYDKSLETISALLPGEDFFRANRQFIISRQAINDISVWFGSRLTVNLKPKSPERIVISKARVSVFKKWLAGTDS